MCGIAGVYGNPDFETVYKMTESIIHRGRDGTKYYQDDHVSIGHNQLSILDKNATQPQTKGDWVVFLNGCIYNHLDLRKQLHYKYHTKTDTETIAVGIHDQGLKFIDKLNGMFAIVAYNSKTKAIHFFRDRYGIKPLYVWENGNQIVFASEIKAILQHPKYKVKVNRFALRQYLTYMNIYTSDTLFEGIHQVPTTWELEFKPEQIDYQEAKGEFRRLFKQAVKRQLIGEVKVGAWLSGGIDSTAIVSEGIKRTFTAGFDNYDERPLARKTADHYRTTHREIEVTYPDMLNVMEKVIYHLEDLRVGPCHANYLLAQETAKHVKVNLQGTGGDELFAGYPWRYEDDYWDVVNRTGLGYEREVFDQMFKDRHSFDLHFLKGVLTVGDRMSMAHSIEDRVPFLDNDLVDFATRLPLEYRFNKRILRESLDLPREVVDRKKWGFTSPDKLWYGSEVLNNELLINYVDPKILVNPNPNLVWCLLSFQTWLKVFTFDAN